ncbi:metalloendopeptidase [Mycena amicta]|nr:metalloendopeptidase [Mycena amicta]
MDSLLALWYRISYRQLGPIPVGGVDWKLCVQVVSWLITGFETYLLWRQYSLCRTKTEPPAALKDHITQSQFDDSRKYTNDGIKFALIAGIYSQGVNSLLLHFGLHPWAWKVVGLAMTRMRYGVEYETIHSIGFVLLLNVISNIVTVIPLSTYKTFVLEEKHGFNKTTAPGFASDHAKALVAAWSLVGFVALALWGLTRAVTWLGGLSFAWMAGGFLLVVLPLLSITMVIYRQLIQPPFNTFSPLRPGEIRLRVEALAKKLHFPLKNIYEINSSTRGTHSGAYLWITLVMSDTLLQHCTPEQIEAVVAHELGHYCHSDLTKLLVLSHLHVLISTFVVACTMFYVHWAGLLVAFGFPTHVAKQHPPLLITIFFKKILNPLEILFKLGMNAINRRFEWSADRFASNLQYDIAPDSDTDNTIDALIAIDVQNLSNVWVDWLYSACHHTHPTLIERLDALKDLQSKRSAEAKKAL